MDRKLVSLIFMQICFTWVVAQDGDGNVTATSVLITSLSPERAEVATNNEEVQSDQGVSPSAVAASVTEPEVKQQSQEEEATVNPTRAPNLQSTTAPPLVRENSISTEEPPKTTQTPGSSTSKPNHANSIISGANLALIVVGASALRFFY